MGLQTEAKFVLWCLDYEILVNSLVVIFHILME